MCQQCTQKALELESKINALKEETLKLASQMSYSYSDAGSIGAACAIGLHYPEFMSEVQIEEVVKGVTAAAHILGEADKLLQELFTKTLELGMLKGAQEALFLSETLGDFMMGDDGLPSTKKKPTVH